MYCFKPVHVWSLVSVATVKLIQKIKETEDFLWQTRERIRVFLGQGDQFKDISANLGESGRPWKRKWQQEEKKKKSSGADPKTTATTTTIYSNSVWQSVLPKIHPNSQINQWKLLEAIQRKQGSKKACSEFPAASRCSGGKHSGLGVGRSESSSCMTLGLCKIRWTNW